MSYHETTNANAEYVVGDEFNAWSGSSTKHDDSLAAAGELRRGCLVSMTALRRLNGMWQRWRCFGFQGV